MDRFRLERGCGRRRLRIGVRLLLRDGFCRGGNGREGERWGGKDGGVGGEGGPVVLRDERRWEWCFMGEGLAGRGGCRTLRVCIDCFNVLIVCTHLFLHLCVISPTSCATSFEPISWVSQLRHGTNARSASCLFTSAQPLPLPCSKTKRLPTRCDTFLLDLLASLRPCESDAMLDAPLPAQ